MKLFFSGLHSFIFNIVSIALSIQGIAHGVTFDPATEDVNFWMKSQKEELLKSISAQRNCGRAKNVIFFIGDGMGNPSIVASRIFKGQSMGKTGEETKLAFEEFPFSGLARTYCVDRQVPDSSCTATAIFSGVNGPYYTVGLDGHGKGNDCEGTLATKEFFPTSIMSHAQKAGKKTGIVTTTRITHATPAATYAHSAYRDWEGDSDMPANASACKDIASQLVEEEPGKNFDVIMGGGRRYFFPREMSAEARRMDGKDLVKEWTENAASKQKTHKYVTNKDELNQAVMEKPNRLLGLFSPSHMAYTGDKGPEHQEPHIATMTEAAIKLLDNPEGFVLLVEGGRIDHALHDTNAKRGIIDLLAFEKAIETALSMTNPSETLIIVGADHSHVMTINGYPVRGNPILGVAEVQPEYNLPYTTLMFTNGVGYNYTSNGTHFLWKNVTGVDTQHLDYIQQAGTFQPEGYETHGGEDVGYYALGPWAHLITGSHHLAYVGHLAQFAACLGDYEATCRRTRKSVRNYSGGKLLNVDRNQLC